MERRYDRDYHSCTLCVHRGSSTNLRHPRQYYFWLTVLIGGGVSGFKGFYLTICTMILHAPYFNVRVASTATYVDPIIHLANVERTAGWICRPNGHTEIWTLTNTLFIGFLLYDSISTRGHDNALGSPRYLFSTCFQQFSKCLSIPFSKYTVTQVNHCRSLWRGTLLCILAVAL